MAVPPLPVVLLLAVLPKRRRLPRRRRRRRSPTRTWASVSSTKQSTPLFPLSDNLSNNKMLRISFFEVATSLIAPFDFYSSSLLFSACTNKGVLVRVGRYKKRYEVDCGLSSLAGFLDGVFKEFTRVRLYGNEDMTSSEYLALLVMICCYR